MAVTFDWTTAVSTFLKMDADGASGFGDTIAAIAAGVQGQMQNFIGRTLNVTQFDEYYDGRDRARLFLRKDPIVSVDLLEIDGAPITVGSPKTAAVTIAPSRTHLIHITDFFPWGLQNIHVLYNAGLDPVSDDGQTFVNAGVLWIAQIFKNRNNVGRTSIVRQNGQQDNFTDKMPATVQMALTTLQRPAVPTC